MDYKFECPRHSNRACNSPLCLSYLFQRKLPDFVVLRLTGFVFLLLLSSLLQKHKTCRPQSNKIKQFALEKVREAEGRIAGPTLTPLSDPSLRLDEDPFPIYWPSGVIRIGLPV